MRIIVLMQVVFALCIIVEWMLSAVVDEKTYVSSLVYEFYNFRIYTWT